jgi:hypothetical protein
LLVQHEHPLQTTYGDAPSVQNRWRGPQFVPQVDWKTLGIASIGVPGKQLSCLGTNDNLRLIVSVQIGKGWGGKEAAGTVLWPAVQVLQVGVEQVQVPVPRPDRYLFDTVAIEIPGYWRGDDWSIGWLECVVASQ